MSNRSSLDEVCIICHDSLRLQADSDSDDEARDFPKDAGAYIYDDVELPCRHHLHYDCARDLYGQSSAAITTCPLCNLSLLTHGRILVTVRNEGGVTEEFDLGQDLEEQQQLEADPILARNEAFLSFCFTSDHEAMKDLLRDGADANAVQRGTGMTGLHLCALNNDAAGITILLGAGAHRHIKGVDGGSPLDLAVAEGSHDAACALQQ